MKKIITVLSLMAIVVITLAVTGSMALTSGNYEYTVVGDTVTVNKYLGNERNVIIPSEIDGKRVTVIGDNAFKNKNEPATVIIPSTVVKIGEAAFLDCGNLTDISIPNSVSEIGRLAFTNCRSLYRLELPYGLVSIPQFMCRGCTSLNRLYIPDTVQTVGFAAFRDCGSLTDVELPDSIVSFNAEPHTVEDGVVYGETFKNCDSLRDVTLPENLTYIPDRMFENCNSLNNIYIPQSVTEIGLLAFKNCESLGSIDGAEGLLKIGSHAFEDCRGLEKIILSDGLTEIYDYAFYNCNGATEIFIPAGVNSIGKQAFENCYNVRELTIKNGVTDIGIRAFANCNAEFKIVPSSVISAGDGAFDGGGCVISYSDACPTSDMSVFDTESMVFESDTLKKYNGDRRYLTVPEKVNGVVIKKIESDAFAGCNSLEALVLPETITEIGSGAFSDCVNLHFINLKQTGVTLIKDRTFSGCRSLTYMYIPDTINSIGASAFADCDYLADVIFEGDTAVNESTFSQCARLTITAEKTAPIKQFCFDMGIRYLEPGHSLEGYVQTGESVRVDVLDGSLDLSAMNLNVNSDSWDLGYFRNGQRRQTARLDLWQETPVDPGEVRFVVDIPWGYDSSLINVYIRKDNNILPVEYVIANGKIIFYGEMCEYIAVVENSEDGTDISDFVYTVADGRVKITGYVGNARDVIIPNIIENQQVYEIGADAFAGNTQMDSVIIPGSVRVIGARAFSGCENLRYVSMENVKTISDEAFSFCHMLGEIALFDGLETIGYQAFYECSSLDFVRIPDSVTSVGAMAFANCYALNRVELGSGATDYSAIYTEDNPVCGWTFDSCGNLREVVLSDNMTEIAPRMFAECRSLEEITISGSIEVIRNGAFRNCNNLRTVNLNAPIREIWTNAFYDCHSLTDIRLPQTLQDIGYAAFRNCNSLSDIVIPESVTNIGNEAFWDCNSMRHIEVQSPNVTVSRDAFNTNIDLIGYAGSTAAACAGGNISFRAYNIADFETADNTITGFNGNEENLYIPYRIDGYVITAVASHAFEGNTRLKYVSLPSSVTSIGPYAFKDCTSLERVNIEDTGITFIKDYTFMGCTSLYTSVVPDAVTGVGCGAFSGCTSLLEVTYYGDAVTGMNVYDNCPKLVIYGTMQQKVCGYARAMGIRFAPYKNRFSRELQTGEALSMEILDENYDSQNKNVNVWTETWDFNGLFKAGERRTVILTEVRRDDGSPDGTARPIRYVIDYPRGYDRDKCKVYQLIASNGTWTKTELNVISHENTMWLDSATPIDIAIVELSEETPALPGDITGDGNIDVLDVIALQKYCLNN